MGGNCIEDHFYCTRDPEGRFFRPPLPRPLPGRGEQGIYGADKLAVDNVGTAVNFAGDNNSVQRAASVYTAAAAEVLAGLLAGFGCKIFYFVLYLRTKYYNSVTLGVVNFSNARISRRLIDALQ